MDETGPLAPGSMCLAQWSDELFYMATIVKVNPIHLFVRLIYRCRSQIIVVYLITSTNWADLKQFRDYFNLIPFGIGVQKWTMRCKLRRWDTRHGEGCSGCTVNRVRGWAGCLCQSAE